MSQHAPAHPGPGSWRILRHELPDGSAHLDLLVWPSEERPDPARPLACFRLPIETDPLPHREGCVSFDAEPIRDHRAVYLTHTGEIDPARGSVTGIGAGRDADLRVRDDEMTLTIGSRRYRGVVGFDGRAGFVYAGSSET
ncbi:MAG: hypothetical protein ACF8Q5_12940 [Phycisphaerales bacterium JB040]